MCLVHALRLQNIKCRNVINFVAAAILLYIHHYYVPASTRNIFYKGQRENGTRPVPYFFVNFYQFCPLSLEGVPDFLVQNMSLELV